MVLPPWARDFDAQRRMQVTLATFGVATYMPPPPPLDCAAATGANRPRPRQSAPAQRPAARWVSRTRTAFSSLRPTGLADGLALRATTGTVRWIRPFGDRLLGPRTGSPAPQQPRQIATGDSAGSVNGATI